MDVEQQEQLLQDMSAIKKDMHAIKQAVVGDAEIGLSGLVTRMERVEGKIRALDLRIAGVAGGAAVLVFIIEHMFK